jgi:hypothetical protein
MTLAQRLTALEKKFDVLSKKVDHPKDWRNIVGTLRDTPLAREADTLGQQFRSKQKRP